MSQTSYLLQCQAEEPLFLMALVIYSSILSHGIYLAVFSSTSLNSPSCLFISFFSFLPPSPSIGLWLIVGFGFFSGRFGGERMQSSRKHHKDGIFQISTRVWLPWTRSRDLSPNLCPGPLCVSGSGMSPYGENSAIECGIMAAAGETAQERALS